MIQRRQALSLALITLFILPVATSVLVTATPAQNTTTTPPPTPTLTANETATATRTATATATPSTQALINASEWEPPGPFTRTELRATGESFPGAEPSMRAFGPYSLMWFQHKGVGGTADLEYINPDTPITTTQLELTAWRMGADTSRNYTLHIVYYQDATKTITVGDRTEPVPYAANQTHEQKEIILGPYKTETTVRIRGYYDDPVRMTMWLETTSGERVATWPTYTIKTVPTSKPVTIDTEHGFWATVFWRFGWVTLLGLPIAVVAGRRTLDRTITGTGWGVRGWVLIGAIVAVVMWMTYTYQASVLLTRFPQLPGVLTTLIVYLGYIEVTGPRIETGEFQLKDLEKTTALTSRRRPTDEDSEGPEEVMQARHRHIVHKQIARQDGRIYFLKPGVLAFIARLRAEPAWIDESELRQLDRVTGDVDWYFEIDPVEMDEPVEHTPESLAFDVSFRRELTGEEEAAFDDRLAALDDRHWTVALVRSILMSGEMMVRRVNWASLGIVTAGATGAYGLVVMSVGLPSLGVAAALLAGLVLTVRATSGSAYTEFAPYQFNSAETTRRQDVEAYKEARTFEGLLELFKDMDFAEIDAWEEAAHTMRKKYQEEYNRRFGPAASDEQPAAPTANDD